MLATILLIFLLQQLNYNYVSALVLVYALIQSFTYDIKLAVFDSVLVFNYFITDAISNSAAIVLFMLMLWLIISISQSTNKSRSHESLPLLILALIAIVSLASSNNIISTIVSIELQSLVLYVVLAFTYANSTTSTVNMTNTTIQAAKDSNSQFGLAYLLNAAVATAFLLLGLSYNQPIVIGIALL
jgi:NADH:ubiquinone oxidoreductase subunit 2 (subunit N)